MLMVVQQAHNTFESDRGVRFRIRKRSEGGDAHFHHPRLVVDGENECARIDHHHSSSYYRYVATPSSDRLTFDPYIMSAVSLPKGEERQCRYRREFADNTHLRCRLQGYTTSRATCLINSSAGELYDFHTRLVRRRSTYSLSSSQILTSSLAQEKVCPASRPDSAMEHSYRRLRPSHRR